LFAASLCSAQTDRHASAPTRETYAKLAKQVDDALQSDVLSVWFPRAVDKEHGGFHSHFGRDWQPLPSDGKFSVFQGRMTWVASQVVSRDPGRREEFLPYVRQGLSYLQNTMWDKQYGGFYWGLDDDGKITPQFSDHKDLYGISFCIYGAAAAYAATKDPAALELARKGFEWADEHAHDAKNGGYFEVLTREGKPEMAKPDSGRAEMNEIGPVGYKSMNTHIHLLESLTELYRVWPNAGLRARVEEMLAIVRDKISMEPGVMNLYFTPDWRPIPDHDSYGHDVETAYLMLETDEVLHGKGSASTERMAKMLVDHALAYGWDSKNGGFFREGTTFGKPEDTMKEWWIQVEGLNALLLMHERYGRGNPVYFERFLEQWHFIQKHTIDAEHRGLWNLTSAEGQPVTLDKGSIWKAAYHDGRAFMNVSARLHKLADEK
jgi:mannobiose 2-epimerase